MKEIIKQIESIDGVEMVAPYEGKQTKIAIVVFKDKVEQKEKPVFVNSKGDEFFVGDMCWWYEKKGIRVAMDEVDRINVEDRGEDYGASEIFKTPEDAVDFGVNYVARNLRNQL